MDNIFIELLWPSLKQEAVYMHEITPSQRISLQSPDRQWTVYSETDHP
jgi:hypothetical protein